MMHGMKVRILTPFGKALEMCTDLKLEGVALWNFVDKIELPLSVT
jgi:hypothetical protein